MWDISRPTFQKVEEAGELILQLSDGESERDEREEKERMRESQRKEVEQVWFDRKLSLI